MEKRVQFTESDDHAKVSWTSSDIISATSSHKFAREEWEEIDYDRRYPLKKKRLFPFHSLWSILSMSNKLLERDFLNVL